MSMLKIKVVCCDDSPQKHSRLVEFELDPQRLTTAVDSAEQNVDAGEEREMHNAAHHPEHGPVTYLQEVHDGGFSVFVGPADRLEETFVGRGEFIAFMDDEGPGHASKVGPDGVQRTLRVLKGHLDV